ncbi:MAG: transcriptional regulator MraZ [Solirubrobacterales bacterium]|nr:transcriptional regulator MraZ [Solirubrobacterales bacterium]
MAFRGQYEHRLDAKDRLTVPARYRGELEGGVVLLNWLDLCVAIYPQADFAEFAKQRLSGLNPLSKNGRRMIRRFYGDSSDETLDSAGRVRLPANLIAYAGLDGPCTVVGALDHLEVWNPERWATEQAETAEEANRMAEEFAAVDWPSGATS